MTGSFASLCMQSALASTEYKINGPANTYLYNPPWTPSFMRRNEVVYHVASKRE